MRTDPFRICSTSFRVGLPRTACSFLCNFSSFEVMESFLWHFKQQLLLTMSSAERPLNALFHACAEVLHSSNNRVLKRQLTIWQLAIWCPAIPSLMLSFGRTFPCYSCQKTKSRLHTPISTVVHREVVCAPNILSQHCILGHVSIP